MMRLSSWPIGLALAAIVALYLLPFPFSIMNFDLARDVAIASAIARGEALPLEGPIFAGAIHAGPWWYYLFAIPFAFAPSVLLAVLWIGVLAALKIPLAYMIGARFVDRTTGLLWALLLILPGWETFESITVLHTSLVGTCTLGFLWFALLYAHEGRPAHLVAAGLVLAIAFHAHPSTFGLTFLLLAIIIYRHHRQQQPWWIYGALAVGVIAPFLPYLLFQASTGFPDWYGGANYVMGRDLGNVHNLPQVFIGLFASGPATVAYGFAARIGGMMWILIGGYGLIYAGAASGLVISIFRNERRMAIVSMGAAFLVLLVTVVALRAETLYHLTFVLWVFASGLLALGLRVWFGIVAWRPIAVLAVAFASAWTVFLQGSVASSLERGAYRFAFLPLFDIKQPMEFGAPMPFIPTFALRASGDLLCAAPSIVVHGVLPIHLLHDYAIEARLVCGGVSHILLGGRGADATVHSVGISRTLVDTLKLPIKAWIGPVGVTSPVQIVRPTTGVSVPSLQQYPPITDLNDRGVPSTLEFDTAADEIVLVTNMYFTFSQVIEARANGVPVPVTARDQVSSAYFCAACARDARVHWRLDIAAPALDRIDVVTVADRNN